MTMTDHKQVAIQIAASYFMATSNDCVALTRDIEAALAAQAKAYGGCQNCYGKGFHTKRVGTSSRYGNTTHDTIGFCTCDRGKQLEKVMAAQAPLPRNDLANVGLDNFHVESEGHKS